MKSVIAVLFALSASVVIAAESPKQCNANLSLSGLSNEVGGLTKIEVTKSLCVDAKQFSSIAMADLENWKISKISNEFWMFEPQKDVASLAVLFEPGQKTGHAVLLLPNPTKSAN
jgi:hypothetical protein